MESLILVAEKNGPTMMARIGLHACVEPRVERGSNPHPLCKAEAEAGPVSHLAISGREFAAPTFVRSRLKKDVIAAHDRVSSNFGEITMRTRWSIAIHHEDRSEDSLISEDHFVHFADVHERMKKNKGKIFVVKIPKTAKPLEVQAFNNLRRLGYRVETI